MTFDLAIASILGWWEFDVFGWLLWILFDCDFEPLDLVLDLPLGIRGRFLAQVLLKHRDGVY